MLIARLSLSCWSATSALPWKDGCCIEAAFFAGLVVTAVLTRQIEGRAIDAAALTGAG